MREDILIAVRDADISTIIDHIKFVAPNFEYWGPFKLTAGQELVISKENDGIYISVREKKEGQA